MSVNFLMLYEDLTSLANDKERDKTKFCEVCSLPLSNGFLPIVIPLIAVDSQYCLCVLYKLKKLLGLNETIFRDTKTYIPDIFCA
jgi:hypothetical protein